MMWRRGARKIPAALFGYVLLVGFLPLQAAEWKGGGTVTYVPVKVEQSTLPSGQTVVRTDLSGVVLADDTSNPFHLAGQTCEGTTIISAKGPSAAGYCNTIDKDGDAWWIWWRGEGKGKGGVWEFVDGTGKYKGIKGKGTTTTLVRFPDGRQVLRWQGSWRLK